MGPRSPRLCLQGLLVAATLCGIALLAPGLSAQAAPAAPDRVDLLSWGAGAFVVRLDAPATDNTAKAVVDGGAETINIGIPRREPLPHRLVVELPSATTFHGFAVPEMNEFGPARGRHVKTVVIEGSMEGPESGFRPLATLILEMDRGAPQEFPVTERFPVRWLRVELRDRMLPAPADFDPHTFSELQGFGVQEQWNVPGDRFTGLWRVRRTGINDSPGLNVMELMQEGSELRGCQVSGGQHTTSPEAWRVDSPG